jgi:hypothetical protein
MKRKITIALIAAVVVFMMMPSSGYSWHRYPVHHHGHVYFYGWVPAAIIAGTFFTSAIILSSAYERPRPPYRPPAAYMDPTPPAHYPPPGRPYADPDPRVYSENMVRNPAGEWVNHTWPVGKKYMGTTTKGFVPANP